MSDDDKNGAYDANQGVTLPEGSNATHDISLSPLFTIREGHVSPGLEYDAAIWRGLGVYLLSQNSARNDLVYFIGIGDIRVSPSMSDIRAYAFSLRCLVSTTNS